MGDTMPTVVAKGLIGVRLDRQYATAERRAESLMFLRRAWDPAAYAGTSAVVPADGVDVAAKTNSLSDAERSLLNKQWFGKEWAPGDAIPDPWTGSDLNWWHRIDYPRPTSTGGAVLYTTVKLDEAQVGRKILTLGLMRALEISFGLEPGDAVPVTTAPIGAKEFDAKLMGKEPKDLQNPKNTNIPVKDVKQGPGSGETVLDLAACRRNLPVDVYWVCGKLDGFEVQVSWNQHQVTVFMVTPPIRFPVVLDLKASKALSNTGGTGARKKKAMQSDARGMLWVGNSGTVARPDYTDWLLALSDGGVTPG